MPALPGPILITGGAGFIGVNLAERLLSAGHTVTILDNLSRRGTEHNLAWLQARHGARLRFVRGDIRVAALLDEIVPGHAVIYHLASQTAVTTSVRAPREDFEINALGTLNVLEAARRGAPAPILVFASTNKVYGGLEHLAIDEQETRYALRDLPQGIDETQPLDFHSPYGCSKGAADQYVRDYARIYGLPTVVFRQSCIYGPRQMGVEDQGWVAWFVIAALTGRPITIYGNGKQVRDLLYIDDLIEALLLAVQRIEVTAGQIYNIGGGPTNALSIWWELRPLLAATLDRPLPEPRFEPWRPGDQPIFVADTRKALRDFGWQPRTPIATGLARLVAWVREQRDLFDRLGAS